VLSKTEKKQKIDYIELIFAKALTEIVRDFCGGRRNFLHKRQSHIKQDLLVAAVTFQAAPQLQLDAAYRYRRTGVVCLRVCRDREHCENG